MRINRLVIAIAIALLIVPVIVSAQGQDCDYYTYEDIEVVETRAYWNGKLMNDSVEVVETNLRDESVRFKVYNPYVFPVVVNMTYEGHSKWYGNKYWAVNGTVGAKEFQWIEGGYWADRTNFANFAFSVQDPPGFTWKEENVVKTISVCHNCSDGEEICEDAEGTPRCVKRAGKESGGTYFCEWECASQFGENGRCIEPLTTLISVTKPSLSIGESTSVSLSLDNAASKEISTNLVIAISDGASLSAITKADTCTPNLCKIFRKVPSKGVNYVSFEATCESVGDVTFSSSITYGTESQGNTITDSAVLTCSDKSSTANDGNQGVIKRFLRWLLRFFD